MNPVLSPNTKAILLLTAPLIVGRGGAASDLLTPGEYKRLARHLREIQRQPADLLSSDATKLLHACQSVVNQERLKQLLERGFLLSQAVERWQSRAIWVVSRADAEYPRRLKARLKEDAPAVLYGCGDINILETGGLAVVGSRNVSDTLVDYTIEIGRLSAKAGRTLVSGGAKGIDQAAMRGALEAGGLVSGILADNLEKTAMNREHRNLLMDGQLVLLSPYDPNASFNVGNAMQRNKLIYSLADAALVVSSDLNKGGTWAGAVEQLDKLRLLPIYVRSTGEAEKGLEALRKKGALPWPNPQDADNFDTVFDVSIHDIYTDDQHNHSLFASESTTSYQPENLDEAASFLPSNSVTADTVMATKTSSPSEILFAEVRKLLTQLLRCPMKEVEVAAELQVSNAQAKEWLRRLLEEGIVEKRSKPVSYVIKQASLFEQRTPTDSL